MNLVQMIGNLARAVEIKQYGTEEDKVYGRTLIALSRHGKREGTDYVRIVLWGRMALNAARYLAKGSRDANQGGGCWMVPVFVLGTVAFWFVHDHMRFVIAGLLALVVALPVGL